MFFSSSYQKMQQRWSITNLSCFFWCIISNCSFKSAAELTINDNKPYEFAFNIVDFQHRFEKKDADGIVTGEYGFITADGVYHETGYATNKDGDFVITKMKNRRITSLKDAQEIFKDSPEKARQLVEAVARTCASCKLLTKHSEDSKETTKLPPPSSFQEIQSTRSMPTKAITIPTKIVKTESPKGSFENSEQKPNNEILQKMMNSAKSVINNNSNRLGKTLFGSEASKKMVNNLYYQFNYTISTHEHQENGYRDGKKDGTYRSQNENGIDTRVEYLSNEFGHQPNITFVSNTNNSKKEEHGLKGFSFLWFNPK